VPVFSPGFDVAVDNAKKGMRVGAGKTVALFENKRAAAAQFLKQMPPFIGWFSSSHAKNTGSRTTLYSCSIKSISALASLLGILIHIGGNRLHRFRRLLETLRLGDAAGFFW
jgi:hypothetical protein